jgi:hypothetical protein
VNLSDRLRGSLPGIVTLAVLTGTTGLLIAGYGIPVGLGALGGLVLGFFAGLFGSLSTFRGTGQVTFGGSGSGAWNYLSTEVGETTESRAELMQELTEILGVDNGRVRSITPVLETVEAAGLSVELLDLELCDAGLALNLEIRVLPGAPPPASMARVSIEDDAGTAYRASAQGQGWLQSVIRTHVVAIPAPPRYGSRPCEAPLRALAIECRGATAVS